MTAESLTPEETWLLKLYVQEGAFKVSRTSDLPLEEIHKRVREIFDKLDDPIEYLFEIGVFENVEAVPSKRAIGTYRSMTKAEKEKILGLLGQDSRVGQNRGKTHASSSPQLTTIMPEKPVSLRSIGQMMIQRGIGKSRSVQATTVSPLEGVIFIGKKNTENYVLATILQFNKGAGDVSIKARGRAIHRAVDVAEIVRTRVMSNVKVDSIEIGTEQVIGEKGEKINVSTIEIRLGRGE